LCKSSVLAHPFKNVREGVSRLLSIVLDAAAGHAFPELEAVFQVLIAHLPNVVAVPDEKEPKADEDAEGFLYMDTLLLTLLHTLYSGLRAQALSSVVMAAMPHVFAMVGVQDKELKDQAAACSQGLSFVPASAESLAALCSMAQATLEHPVWHVRRNAVLSLQGIFFVNLFRFSVDQRRLLISAVKAALKDRVLEVREQASVTLTGLLRCACDETFFVELREEFEKGCVGKKANKKAKKATAARHGSVLGLCAVVATHPYDLPIWGVQSLSVLGGQLSYPEPIAGTVKKAFTEFWRTHRDTWAEIQAQHSPEDLEIVSGFSTSPHYYA